MLNKVERLIAEINKVQAEYAKDYFDTEKVKKLDLTQPLSEAPVSEILRYRLYLHEALNDYLIFADLSGITFHYRVKSSEAIQKEIEHVNKAAENPAIEVILNDILGIRVVLTDSEILELFGQLTVWQKTFGLVNWEIKYTKYGAILYCHFKDKQAYAYPWELQIWDEEAKQAIRRKIK